MSGGVETSRSDSHEVASAPSSAPRGLPSPDDRPEAEVVIFDGHCKFCTRQVARLARWDGRGRFAFLSLHDPRVAERYPDLTHEQMMQQIYLIDRRGRRLGGATAFRYLSRKLPRLWPLAPLLHIPFSLPFWQWAYRSFARIRYRFGRTDDCDDGTCKLHFD